MSLAIRKYKMWFDAGSNELFNAILCLCACSRDSFTVCMETVTAFVDGPLALVVTYAFVKQTSYRYVAQLVLSLCQLYGDVLYFSTEMFDGFIHGPRGHMLYFWFYFVFLNSLWIFIPLACIIESWKKIVVSQAATDVTSSSRSKRHWSTARSYLWCCHMICQMIISGTCEKVLVAKTVIFCCN